MKIPVKPYLWILAITLAACTGQEPAPATGTHVDIAVVAASGHVSPVNGITSSGQPDEAALRVFADAGYVAVIDLRGPDEDRGMADERAAAEALGLDYVALPIAGREAINFDTAKQLDEVLQGIDGPVLLHCGSGNRVGAILALRESLHGADNDQSIAYGKDAGLTGLEGVVRERLGEK